MALSSRSRARSILVVLLCNLRFFVIAFVDQDPVAKLNRLSSRNGVTAILFFVLKKIGEPERIRSQQSISTGMPIRLVAKALRVIEDYDTQLMAVDASIDT